jgi:hypothetical protein
MTDELMRPIDPETAKAIQEASKVGGKVIDAGTGIGRYLDRVLGRVPDNLVGYLIGDWLAEKRLRRYVALREETNQILGRRGVSERADVSPSIAIPLIEAAIDALVLQKVAERPQPYEPNTRDALATILKLSTDEIELSAKNLAELGCFTDSGGPNWALTPKGRVLMRVLQD